MTLSEIEHAPFRHQVSIRVQASAEAIFSELAEPARWLNWFPLMHKCAWSSQETAAVGAEREVALYVLGRFRERMVAWDPNARLAFTMIGSTSPLASQMAEDHQLVSLPGGITRFDYAAALVLTPAGRVAAPVLRRVLSALVTRACRNVERVLAPGTV